MPRRKQPKDPIPEFSSSEEEAEFWDTHSPLDYPEYWQEDTEGIEVGRPLEHVLSVRLDARTLARIMRVGERKGAGASTLARMWIMERLEAEDQARIGLEQALAILTEAKAQGTLPVEKVRQKLGL